MQSEVEKINLEVVVVCFKLLS